MRQKKRHAGVKKLECRSNKMALVDGMPRPLKAGSIGYRKSLQGDHPNEDHYHACFEERVKRGRLRRTVTFSPACILTPRGIKCLPRAWWKKSGFCGERIGNRPLFPTLASPTAKAKGPVPATCQFVRAVQGWSRYLHETDIDGTIANAITDVPPSSFYSPSVKELFDEEYGLGQESQAGSSR